MLLGKLEEVGGGGLLDGLLHRRWVIGRLLLLRLWLGWLLSRWWWGQFGLDMRGNALIKNAINRRTRMGSK